MNLLVFNKNQQITGSLINLLDYYQWLLDLGFHTKINHYQISPLTFRNYDIKNTDKLSSDVVITDFFSIITNNEKISGNLCFVFSNLELTYSLLNLENFTIELLYKKLENLKFQKTFFLIVPYIEKTFTEKLPDLDYKIYYKKINTRMLKQIPVRNNGKLFTRDNIQIRIPNRIIERVRIPNYFTYSGYVFSRKKFIHYIEEVGRLVFEFYLLNKEVYIDNQTRNLNRDGFDDYLDYYNAKIENNQLVYLDKEKIDLHNYNLDDLIEQI
jgi:hypothetical protein